MCISVSQLARGIGIAVFTHLRRLKVITNYLLYSVYKLYILQKVKCLQNGGLQPLPLTLQPLPLTLQPLPLTLDPPLGYTFPVPNCFYNYATIIQQCRLYLESFLSSMKYSV